jgi:hypothetical protein
MEEDEEALFVEFLRRVDSYVEFGCGGSTVLASSVMEGTILALDSSKEWVDQVAAACAKQPHRPQPQIMHVDIGPTGDWGRPIDDRFRDRWPLYATSIWQIAGAADADLYLVDGRFRVSCFMETLLRCRPDAVILIHDFAPRPAYHVVREFAREIATRSSLSAFMRRADFERDKAIRLIDLKRYEAD